MSIALGVHVGVDEISAVLIEAELPELGPVAARTVSIASVPGGVGDAATTMLGIMRVQAAQHDLHIARSAIVCDSLLLCGIVRAALAAHHVSDVAVVDAGDPRLDDELPLGIAAAQIGIPATARSTGGPTADDSATGDQGWRGTDTSRSARLAMIGLGVAVLAALSGATVWALTAVRPAENPVVGTADISDVAEIPSSGSEAGAPSSVPAIAGPAGVPPDPSTVPAVEAGLFEAPVYGPVPVDVRSETLPAGPVPSPAVEATGGGPVGEGGNSGSNKSDDGSPDTATVDPKPKPKPKPNPVPKPEPEPEPETGTEEPPTDSPTTTTDSPTTTTDSPTTTTEAPETTSTVSEPAENPVE
ncbi:Shikimate kinase [Rhodococcus sp. AW25M09]|uniref:hypothetical protein n=1 Tax=Rhodococcus sp. AW25M09 TaxID=1268303 RepID=UPI0002ACC1D8|nr:hypothetical protein [Rhodococcus sp. AW25M09]CCQ13722.1 Shikimate kinase [Rhodococcus sp. AW25M09]